MIRFFSSLHFVVLGIALSVVGYMFYFHGGVNFERWIYLMVSSVVTYASLILGNIHNINFLRMLIWTCCLCSIGFSVLNIFFGIYKEIYLYSPWLERSFLTASCLTLFLFLLYAKTSKETVFNQISGVRLSGCLLVVVGVTFLAAMAKIGLREFQVNSTFINLLQQAINTFFLIWTYVFIPVLVVVFILLLATKKLSIGIKESSES